MASSSSGKVRTSTSGIAFIKELYAMWMSVPSTQLAAALAYFGLFSLAPVIYIALSIAGIFLDQAALMDQFLSKLTDAFGPAVTEVVQSLLERVVGRTNSGTLLVTLASFIFLMLAASGVFYQLQYALNTIWNIPISANGTMLKTVRRQLFSFLMVIAVGLLLVIAAAFSFIVNWLGTISILDRFQISILDTFQTPLTALGFILLATLVFGVMYKLLPDIPIAWRDVWAGAAVAASLMTLGGWLVIFFMDKTSLASAVEAAGAFVVLLTGFYYFAHIFLLGAILTRVYAQRFGSMRQLPPDNFQAAGEK